MLLVECNLLENVKVINEGTNGNKRLLMQGKFQKCDEVNNNGRSYPRPILEAQVQAIQDKINERSLVGALDHPANDAIHLSQASHLITKLWVEKNGDVMGECEILSTPNGKIVEALLDCGVKIGISSRGVGSVTEGIKGKIVNEDFKLITFDLVSDPSTRGAFPELTESIQENSQLAQAIVSKHKKDRVLLTMLESKISEAMKKSKKKSKKKDDSGLGMLDGKPGITMKDVLIGRGVITKEGKKKKPMEEGSIKDNPKAFKKAKAKAKAKGQETEMPKPPKRDVRAAVVEGFKKVCWGDRYDENENQTTVAQDIEQSGRDYRRKQARQNRPIHRSLKRDPRTVLQKAGLVRDETGRAVPADQVKRVTGMRPRRAHSNVTLNTSTEIFGQKIAEAFRKLVRKDGKYHEAYRPGEKKEVEKEVASQARVESPEAREARLAREEAERQKKYRKEFAAQYNNPDDDEPLATTNDMSNQHAIQRRPGSSSLPLGRPLSRSGRGPRRPGRGSSKRVFRY